MRPPGRPGMTHDGWSLARRSVIIGAALSLLGGRARASDFAYKNWRFNTDAVHGPLADELVRSLQAQIDLVESLGIKPEIKAFFRRVDVKIDPSTLGLTGIYRSRTSGNALVADTRRIFLTTRVIAPDSPSLLYLLLLAYVDQRVPPDWRKAALTRWLEAAKRTDAFGNRSEMLHSPPEFFAACAAVVLWGRASREPLTREKVRDKLPDFYAWIAKEFFAPGAL